MNKALRIIGVFFMCAAFGLTGTHLFSAPNPLPLISRNCPAYASGNTPGNANDSNYATSWQMSNPAWLAYDLSGVPSSERNQIVVVWYNNDTYDYDHTVLSTGIYNCPRSYTIQGSSAPGGGSAPASGWTTLVTISGNEYHSRQHVINFSGYNWLRMNITESSGGSLSLNLDVHNAARGITDDWIFYGDSITAGGMVLHGAGGSFAQLVNAQNSTYYPVAECGGIGSIMSTHGAQHINTWLTVFPGHYVGIAYGTNDSWGNQTGAGNFYNNMRTIVQAVLNAGKIPVIPTIPWSGLSDISNNAPSYNAQIENLYAAYPDLLRGPDLWTIFKNNPGYLSSDNVHPNDTGYAAMRKAWADAMLPVVYTGGTNPTQVPTTGKLGDVDESGDVNIVDALLISQYYVGLNPANFNSSLGDVTGDGNVDIVDALRIAQCYVGLISCDF